MGPSSRIPSPWKFVWDVSRTRHRTDSAGQGLASETDPAVEPWVGEGPKEVPKSTAGRGGREGARSGGKGRRVPSPLLPETRRLGLIFIVPGPTGTGL